MDQARMLTGGDLWERVRRFVARYNQLRPHFLALAAAAAAFVGQPEPNGGFADNLAVTPVADNYFDVTLMGRTFRFRFVPRVAGPDALPDGHIVVAEVDALTKMESLPLDDLPFDGNARTPLLDPFNGDPIYLTNDASARYLVLHVIYNAFVQAA